MTATPALPHHAGAPATWQRRRSIGAVAPSCARPAPLDLSRPAVDVAPTLLGATLWHGPVGVVITEVEAYMGVEDPASHAHRGPTPRSRVMFGPPGHLYVYLSYGIHHCLNIVCSPSGTASAVLVRAGRVVDGLEVARSRRGSGARPQPDAALARGPGNLGRALGAELSDSGRRLTISEGPGDDWVLRPGRPHAPVAQGPRIGISRHVEAPWRFWIDGDPTVSHPR